MEISINLFDVIFLSLVGLFSLVGLLRGFVREGFSIANWIIAGMVAIYTRPFLSGFIVDKIKLQVVADIISNSISFTVTLIVISLLTSTISKLLSEMVPILINHPLGLFFGFLKAYLIMSVVLITMFAIYDVDESGSGEEKLPDLVRNGKTYNFVKVGANMINPFLGKLFEGETGTMIKEVIEDGDDVEDEGISEEDIKSDKKNDKGYEFDQIEKMGDLIDIVIDR